MSRWTAESDYDYQDEIEGRRYWARDEREPAPRHAPQDASCVEVDRIGWGGWMFPMSTAMLVDGTITIIPKFAVAYPDEPTRIGPGQWSECRVYDERDRLVATYHPPDPQSEDFRNDGTGFSFEARAK